MYIDLNHRLPGRSDQDVSFGPADPRGAFSLINEGEDAGCVGSKYNDAHVLHIEKEEGVQALAAGCMRTYKILHDKVRRFTANLEIKAELDRPCSLGVQSAGANGARAIRARCQRHPRS